MTNFALRFPRDDGTLPPPPCTGFGPDMMATAPSAKLSVSTVLGTASLMLMAAPPLGSPRL